VASTDGHPCLETCVRRLGDELAAKRKPHRKLGRADTYVTRIEKIGRMKRRDQKFLEDTITHAKATATKGNQPGANLEEVLCFPHEACYRPGMTVNNTPLDTQRPKF
jgi:hypothetical protein